ncbi:hypothetical protein [Rhizobium ruizarguesonis]|uniref:hypothetical protein n=1 Tax=Rhizobium ruizarguesonis TaxID=2081791 RepID=UPI001030B58B|nr:hypothetical protein [Rhizobium ruizarguesonis]TBA24722.1 hypothetical protein ELH61_02420 [Rhizobium ruizarguesonis]
MAGTTPEIKTRFTLDGVDKAASAFRRFQQIAAQAFGKTRAASGKTFEPLSKSLTTVESKAKEVAKTLALVGSRTAFTGIKVGAVGAGVAIGGLAGKLALVSKAATAASKETAAALQKIGQDSRRLGEKPGDLAVLGFAGRREGIDQGEISVNLAHLAGTFKKVRDEIGRTRAAYLNWNSIVTEDVKLQRRNPQFRNDNNTALLEENRAALSSAASASVDYLETALRKNFEQFHSFRADDRRDADDMVADRLDYMSAQQGLADQRKAVIDSLGPEGQALFDMRKYGLDIGAASKGGTEGLVALSEAMARVPDAAEKVRLSMLLFGEDAGPKMLTLMNKGRKGIEEYRAELERLGGVVSQSDVDLGEKYEASAENLRTAVGGVKLEIARNLLPYLEQTNKEMTEWLVKSRQVIAKEATQAFLATKGFATDVVHLFQGNGDVLQTRWLDVVVKKTQVARAAVGDLWKQVSLVWSGKDSDWPWLNTVVDTLGTAKRFAVEVFGLFRGKSAKEFGWLNDVKENVIWFKDRMVEAFDLFKGTLSLIKETVRPIFEFFGSDVTSGLLYVGMLRFTGVLGLIGKLLGGVKGGIGAVIATGAGLLGLASGISKVAGFAGRALGVGGAAAGAAGAASTALRTAEAAAGAAAVAASMAGVSRSAAAASEKVASVGKAAADVARGSRLPELIGDIANIAGGAAVVSGRALPGVGTAAGKADEAMGAMSKTATTGLGSILQRLPVVGGAFGSFGSKVAALFEGLTGKVGAYVTALGGIQPALAKLGVQFGILAAVAAGAFTAGQYAMGKWQEMLGTQDSYDGIHKSQADLMRIQGDAYLNKRLGSRDENDILTKRAFYNRDGASAFTGQTASERFLTQAKGLDSLVFGSDRYTGPLAEYQYRQENGWSLDPSTGMYVKDGEKPQRPTQTLPGWADSKQQATPPPVEKRIQLDFNINDKQYSGVFDESSATNLASQLAELARKM